MCDGLGQDFSKKDDTEQPRQADPNGGGLVLGFDEVPGKDCREAVEKDVDDHVSEQDGYQQAVAVGKQSGHHPLETEGTIFKRPEKMTLQIEKRGFGGTEKRRPDQQKRQRREVPRMLENKIPHGYNVSVFFKMSTLAIVSAPDEKTALKKANRSGSQYWAEPITRGDVVHIKARLDLHLRSIQRTLKNIKV